MEGFGKILVELRGTRTQEEVAKGLDIATSTLGMYETERRVSRDSIKMRISDYYQKPVQYIFLIKMSRNEINMKKLDASIG